MKEALQVNTHLQRSFTHASTVTYVHVHTHIIFTTGSV